MEIEYATHFLRWPSICDFLWNWFLLTFRQPFDSLKATFNFRSSSDFVLSIFLKIFRFILKSRNFLAILLNSNFKNFMIDSPLSSSISCKLSSTEQESSVRYEWYCWFLSTVCFSDWIERSLSITNELLSSIFWFILLADFKTWSIFEIEAWHFFSCESKKSMSPCPEENTSSTAWSVSFLARANFDKKFSIFSIALKSMSCSKLDLSLSILAFETLRSSKRRPSLITSCWSGKTSTHLSQACSKKVKLKSFFDAEIFLQHFRFLKVEIESSKLLFGKAKELISSESFVLLSIGQDKAILFEIFFWRISRHIEHIECPQKEMIIGLLNSLKAKEQQEHSQVGFISSWLVTGVPEFKTTADPSQFSGQEFLSFWDDIEHSEQVEWPHVKRKASLSSPCLSLHERQRETAGYEQDID